MPRAYAKINLGLRIIGRREDGHHDIETVLHPVNIFDTIELQEEEREIIIESSEPSVPLNHSNLCWQAAEALRKEARLNRGIRISIEKNIPIGAGLGGGSSDAALVLRELKKIWSLNLRDERLKEIAASIGSDVPYFLRPGTALATGRGELLAYLDLSLPYWIVVVFPNIRISTKWAYQRVECKENPKSVDLRKLLLENLDKPRYWMDKLKNDFEEVVFSQHEAVMRIKDSLYAAGARFSQMSGSGSAVYGLFQSEQTAHEIAETIGANLPVFMTEPNFEPIF